MSNSSKAAIITLLIIFTLVLQSCASTVAQPTPSPVSLTFENSTPVFPTHPSPIGEKPACIEKLVFPIIAEVQPSPALPGSEITITGTGGHIQDSCGGFNESARSFRLYLDKELVGDLVCYANRCETKIKLASSIPAGVHCLSTQEELCEFQFRVSSE